MKKFIKILKKEEVKMKKIILSLILIGILKAFVEVPPGWRHRKFIYDSSYGLPSIGTWVCSKDVHIAQVFVRWSEIEPWQTLYFSKSVTAGFSWNPPLAINPNEVSLVYTPRVAIDRYYKYYVAFMSMNFSYPRVLVYTSENSGNTWECIYQDGEEWSPAYEPWCATSGDTFALVYVCNGIKFTYYTPYTWIQPENVDSGYAPRVIVDKDGYFYVFYRQTSTSKLAKRTGQNQWTYYSFPDAGIRVQEPNRIMREDPQTGGVIHFIYSLNNYIYYRRFENGTWSGRIPITNGTNADFVVEPNGKIYAIIANYNNNTNTCTMKYYVSNDYGNTWIYKGELYESKYFCYEKNRWGRGLALIGTEMNNSCYGPVYYQGNDNFCISNKFWFVLAYNNNKHLARVPNSDDLYMVFSMESDSQDVVTARSLDGGQTWENYKLIGHGRLTTLCIWRDPTLPDIVLYLWAHPQINNLLQYRKFTISTNSWSPIYTLPIPEGYKVNLFEYPGISMCFTKRKFIVPKEILSVVFKAITSSEESCLLAIEYDITDPEYPSIVHYQIIARGTTFNPSLSYSYISQLKFHCAYMKDFKIYYSERAHGTTNWTPPYPISQSDKHAVTPSIEVYGDSLYVVWSEKAEGGGKYDIWRRRKKVTLLPTEWGPIELVSINSQNYESLFPTNSELKFTLWEEEDHSYPLLEDDPWFRYGEDAPMPFLNTPNKSLISHGSRYLTIAGIYLYAIWEEFDGLSIIQSHRRSYIPPPSTPDAVSAYLSYSIEENSPYLIQREGIENYGNIKTDFGQTLIYKFELDTIYEYEAEIEFYFEGGNKRKGKVIVSNMNPIIFEYNPGEIKKVKFKIENDFLVDKNLYLTFKNVQGPKISLKSIKIYRYEKEEEIPGGGQGLSLSKIENSILNLYPVFSKEKFKLEYTLNSFSHVEISIYDILGRKIETILKEKILPPGKYINEFRRPENVKPGIYFIRIETENGNEVKKIIFK
jgi:hypothetical protein